MSEPNNLAILRARDFWGAIVLFWLSAFFLWRTSFIPLFGKNRAGVSGIDWYSSAALVPLGIFSALLVLSLILLAVSVRAHAVRTALTAGGLGWNTAEAMRFGTLAVILLSYIVALVPRVDFIICSGLLITALIHGYHQGRQPRMILAAFVMGLAGLYAMLRHLPRAEWNRHDDDVVALILWAGLTVWVVMQNRGTKLGRIIPVLAVTAPLILVLAMAFGFRQNVPNRGGLVFSQIEYHYFVTLKPLWSR